MNTNVKLRTHLRLSWAKLQYTVVWSIGCDSVWAAIKERTSNRWRQGSWYSSGKKKSKSAVNTIKEEEWGKGEHIDHENRIRVKIWTLSTNNCEKRSTIKVECIKWKQIRRPTKLKQLKTLYCLRLVLRRIWSCQVKRRYRVFSEEWVSGGEKALLDNSQLALC